MDWGHMSFFDVFSSFNWAIVYRTDTDTKLVACTKLFYCKTSVSHLKFLIPTLYF